jgi:flagellum-specific ATP synthase
MELLTTYFSRLRQRSTWRWQGRVLEAVGQTIESSGPLCSVGECCEILDGNGLPHLAEVIGFRGSNVLSMPLESTEGIRFGDRVSALGMLPYLEAGEGLIGRVLNASGQPIDDGPRPVTRVAVSLDRSVPNPLERVPIRQPLGTGIRAIDGMLTVGRGQRIGIFGGSGVGKSTLIGMMTRNSEADIIVVWSASAGAKWVSFLKTVLGRKDESAQWCWCRLPTSLHCCGCERLFRRLRWRNTLRIRASMCSWYSIR